MDHYFQDDPLIQFSGLTHMAQLCYPSYQAQCLAHAMLYFLLKCCCFGPVFVFR
jgi:hypothetical protein